MKRRSILALVAITMLCATPAFAAGKANQPASATPSPTLSDKVGDVMDAAGKVKDFITGKDENKGMVNATVNTITASQITANNGGTVDIGNMTQTNGMVNASVNTVVDSEVLADGQGASARIGNMNNTSGMINASVNTITADSKVKAMGQDSHVNIGNMGSN